MRRRLLNNGRSEVFGSAISRRSEVFVTAFKSRAHFLARRSIRAPVLCWERVRAGTSFASAYAAWMSGGTVTPGRS